MTEDEGRAAVVAEALSFQKTPYHHMGALKGVGIDCAMLVLCTYANVGLIEDFRPDTYPPDWHLHREAERYMAIISSLAGPVEREALLPGDVILFKFGRAFSHGAIVIDLPQIIHANRKDGMVVLGDLDRDSDLIGRETKCFSFWAPRHGG